MMFCMMRILIEANNCLSVKQHHWQQLKWIYSRHSSESCPSRMHGLPSFCKDSVLCHCAHRQHAFSFSDCLTTKPAVQHIENIVQIQLWNKYKARYMVANVWARLLCFVNSVKEDEGEITLAVEYGKPPLTVSPSASMISAINRTKSPNQIHFYIREEFFLCSTFCLNNQSWI